MTNEFVELDNMFDKTLLSSINDLHPKDSVKHNLKKWDYCKKIRVNIYLIFFLERTIAQYNKKQ